MSDKQTAESTQNHFSCSVIVQMYMYFQEKLYMSSKPETIMEESEENSDDDRTHPKLGFPVLCFLHIVTINQFYLTQVYFYTINLSNPIPCEV